MNKNEFIAELSGKLSGVAQADKNKAILYYEEIIADRIDDGMSEEQAVESLGDINQITNELMSAMPMVAIMQKRLNSSREKSNNKRLWNIVAICSFPIWLPLLVVFAALILVLYIMMWVLITVFFAVELTFALGCVAGAFSGLAHVFLGNILQGMVFFSASVACLGLFILIFKPLLLMSKQIIGLTNTFWKKLKVSLIREKGEKA